MPFRYARCFIYNLAPKGVINLIRSLSTNCYPDVALLTRYNLVVIWGCLTKFYRLYWDICRLSSRYGREKTGFKVNLFYLRLPMDSLLFRGVFIRVLAVRQVQIVLSRRTLMLCMSPLRQGIVGMGRQKPCYWDKWSLRPCQDRPG